MAINTSLRAIRMPFAANKLLIFSGRVLLSAIYRIDAIQHNSIAFSTFVFVPRIYLLYLSVCAWRVIGSSLRSAGQRNAIRYRRLRPLSSSASSSQARCLFEV